MIYDTALVVPDSSQLYPSSAGDVCKRNIITNPDGVSDTKIRPDAVLY